jgi:hypothetical protein
MLMFKPAFLHFGNEDGEGRPIFNKPRLSGFLKAGI